MKKVPTLLGLILVVGIVGVLAASTTIVQNTTSIFSHADVGTTLVLPVSVGNISDTAFTVYWVSPKPYKGVVLYGMTKSLGDGTVLENKETTNHLVTVTGLKPETKYYFRIGTESKSDPLEVTTLNVPPVALEPIFGKVLNQSNQTVEGAVVVWQDKTVTLSKADGSFVLPVYAIKDGDAEKIVITTDTASTTIDCTYGKDRPLPAVKLGENTSCDVTKPFGATNSFTVPENNRVEPVSGDLVINIEENQVVTNSLPTISGKAGPDQMVKIEVHSPVPYSGTVKADRDGNWTWTSPAGLTPGEHTVTITINNVDGTTQTITRNFIVSANDILPVTSGTPSATPKHKSCVNNACVLVGGSGLDGCVSNTDCQPVIQPEPVSPPVSTISSLPVETPATPQTGALENTLVLIVGGVALIVLGIGLIL
ncbi:fibronectin type III domain-containing protein [Candidatus Microgenomates bacterium]|nr:fibronectin type III domain-containing protein [Candidatus Microgenomates bacterium]